MKGVKKGVNCYLIVRVEQIEAIKDGAEVLSFKSGCQRKPGKIVKNVTMLWTRQLLVPVPREC